MAMRPKRTVAPSYRVIVCGGRAYSNRRLVFSTLDAIHAEREITLLIHGDCYREKTPHLGADQFALAWARARYVPHLGVPAKWKKLGKRAGPERNGRMLLTNPHVVVAFPGGDGTADMLRQAEAFEPRPEIRRIKDDRPPLRRAA